MTTESAQPTAVRLDSGANRSIGVAYAIWAFTGFFGGHRFYLRRTGSGVLYLFTAGLFLVGWIVDGFQLPTMVRKVNTRGY